MTDAGVQAKTKIPLLALNGKKTPVSALRQSTPSPLSSGSRSHTPQPMRGSMTARSLVAKPSGAVPLL